MKNAGGKIDVILLGLILGVNRRRSHVPFHAVDRLADFGEPTVKFEP